MLPTAAELLPSWRATHVDTSCLALGRGWWTFNPSVHLAPDHVWRCAIRCANYSLPRGLHELSTEAARGKYHSRVLIAELDPETWQIRAATEVAEVQHLARARVCASTGLEDLRLFCTARQGLLGVASCLQHNLAHPTRPEIAIVELDADYRAVAVRPIRGPWNGRPQKNWAPFDGAADVRLLYSIDRGVVMSLRGPAAGSPPPVPSRQHAWDESTAWPPQDPPPPDRLRGGTQLVRIADNRWLGLAHEMTMTRARGLAARKYYWHTVYVTDDAGRLVGRSTPLKLTDEHGIEFAAGLAIDGGRVAISYGTDDHDCWIAETALDEVLALLPTSAIDSVPPREPRDRSRSPSPDLELDEPQVAIASDLDRNAGLVGHGDRQAIRRDQEQPGDVDP